MIVAEPEIRETASAASAPHVWGLSAAEALEAYWASRGVHCVRRGQEGPLPAGADLFLLLEPDQLVLFELDRLVDHILWRRAAVTRVRLVDEEREPYHERVLTDADGLVRSVSRAYRSRARRVSRVMLTSRRRLAQQWMTAPSRRAGRVAIRRRVRVQAIDQITCPGFSAMAEQPDATRQVLDRLVSIWDDPSQSIEGLTELADGVWGLAATRPSPDQILIGPAWIGHDGPDAEESVIGPAWIPDGSPPGQPARLRPVDEIEWTGRAAEPPADRRPTSGYAMAKRTFDIVASALVLTLGLPLFALVALCIVIEDGRPIFYAQVRQTRGGHLFNCWKFRSMRRRAESMVGQFAAENICDGPQVAIRNDPRVTRVGHIIRKLQIDELPQFWNVLRGEMSIVGPRPSPERENQFCPAWRELRLSVRPGITGLWQLKRTRAPGQDFQEWIRYDIEYVTHASFLFDLSICFRTAWTILRGRRA